MSGSPVGGERQELDRALGPLQVWALALGCVIGFGCFVLPGDFLRQAGPLGASLGVAIGGLAMVVITRSYGLMVRTFPVAGGEFAYAYGSAGRYHAYICGWLLALGYLCVVPLNATALAVLGKFIAPELFARGYLYSVAGFDVYAGEVLLASTAIIVLGYFQRRGAREAGGIQLVMTLALVAGVAAIALGTLSAEEATLDHMSPAFPSDRSAIAAILSIMAISPWLYVGFDTLPQAAEEFNFSPDQGQRLMTSSIGAGAVMYIIVILATAAILPWQELVASGSIWPTGTTVEISLGRVGLLFLGLAVTFAILTGINGFFMASSRLLFGMGRSRVLPGWFRRVHPKLGTPANAILFTGAVSLVAPWLGREVILWIVDMSAVGTSVGYFYTCYGAWVISGRTGEGGPRQRLWAGLGMALSASFLVLLLVPGMPAFMALPSWIALGAWLALGALFFLLRARDYRAIPEKELDYLILGRQDRPA